MTDLEYEILRVLLQTKELNEYDLRDLKAILSDEDYTDYWDLTIGWLNSLPDIPIRPMRRMTPDDYRKNSLG